MSSHTAAVAIITRTQNRPRLLERAIRSVHEQTYQDIVHVIINDGGERGAVEEALERTGNAENERITIIHNKSVSGMETASNTAIKNSKSKYIAIHDDDDTWHPDCLRLAVERLEQTGALGVVVRADKVIEELQPDGTAQYKKTQPLLPDMRTINLYRQCSTTNQMTPITFIYRRSVFEEIGYYDENLEVCGDWDFGIRFLSKYDVEFLDPGYALANYHHRPYRPGLAGNTSYAGNDKAGYWTNYLMNKYLRQELTEGRLGVGYIMNKIHYDNRRMSQFANRILPKPIAAILKRRAQD